MTVILASRAGLGLLLGTHCYLRWLDQPTDLLTPFPHARRLDAKRKQENRRALQRSAPSLEVMRSEAARSGFILHGSFFKATHLPARTH
jgi:hypothetical protein